MGSQRKTISGCGFIQTAILACALFGLAAFPASAQAQSEARLKNACISATLRAIGMEMNSTAMKLEAARNGPGNPAAVPALEKRMKELQIELGQLAGMDSAAYDLPEKKTVSVLITNPCKPGSILELEDMTKSGPFYHVAGIEGDDYSVLVPGKRYTLAIYPVYKRDYVLPFVTNSYVYVTIAGGQTAKFSLGARQTGEEILEALTVGNGSFSFTAGSNGCTDKGSFKVDVKKTEGISEKAPHYILTVLRIVPDTCKAIVDEGTIVTFDLAKDLGLSGTYTFSIANRVYSRHQWQF